jgi:hypothetical protein
VTRDEALEVIQGMERAAEAKIAGLNGIAWDPEGESVMLRLKDVLAIARLLRRDETAV